MPVTARLYRRSLRLIYCSSLWSLITIVAQCVEPLRVYAEWVNVGSKIERGLTVYTAYLETDSISRKGNVVTLWTLFDYMTIQSIVGGPWLSSKTRWQYDCLEETVQLLGYMTFTGNMGSGEAVYSNSEQSRWEPVTPDSIDQKVWNIVCTQM